jgi:cation diffusion facilitator family transporter
MASRVDITPDALAKERSILFALVADTSFLGAYVTVGILGGSLTIMAEAIRGALMTAIEAFSLLVLRRIHRGVLTDFEFGTGKLEQVANLAVGAGLLGGAIWIAVAAAAIVTGQRPVGTPLGLTLAAILGVINTYVNVLAWDSIRRVALGERSPIMQTQLKVRIVKLVSSLFVQVAMTIAALSTDDVVVAWADAVGSFFVVGFIVVYAVKILRAGFPDIIDRAVDDEVQNAIKRALARHLEDYDQLHRVRSRRSGERVFVEISLGFDGGLTMSEVNRRIAALTATMRQEIAHADIAVLASSHEA